MKTPSGKNISDGLKKIWRNKRKIGTGLLIASYIGYVASPKIQRCNYQTKNKLVDSLDTKKKLGIDTVYGTNDWETNVVLDLMSGMADKEQVHKLFKKYRPQDTAIDIQQYLESDPAMYKTIWQMHQKYGNPRVTVSKAHIDYFTGKQDYDRAFFEGFSNTIQLHKLDSSKIVFHNISDQYVKKVYEDSLLTHNINTLHDGMPLSSDSTDKQRYLINNWIAELSHAKVRKEQGPIRPGIDVIIDHIKLGLLMRSRSSLYKTPGDYEWIAHSRIEPDLAQEFIQLYIKYSDINNPKVKYKIGILYNGYFDKYKDSKKAEEWLKAAANAGNKEADYILGVRYWKEYRQNYITDTSTSTFSSVDTSISYDLNKITSNRDHVLENMLYHFGRSARSGSIYAYKTLIDICTYCEFPNSKKIGIGYAEELMKNFPILLKKDKTYEVPYNKIYIEQVRLYEQLSHLYEKNNQHDVAKKICDEAEKLIEANTTNISK